MDKIADVSLSLIFQFIDDYREKVRLERVCRRWRFIMLRDGWKQVRRIKLGDTRQIEPIANRCGGHLVECRIDKIHIDSALIRFIAEHFFALKHLDFRDCELDDANALESFRDLGARLRSLNLTKMDYKYDMNHQFFLNFPRLRHLGLDISCKKKIASLQSRFPAELCSLRLNCFPEFGPPELEQILTCVQRDSTRLMALDLFIVIRYSEQTRAQLLLSQILELKSLRFLCISCYLANPLLLCSCLSNLPQLRALKIGSVIQFLPYVFRSSSFRGLVHLTLNIFIFPDDCGNYEYEPIGLLSDVAPQLRSLSLDIFFAGSSDLFTLDFANKIECEMLKLAHNGILEHLEMPYASIANGILDQLVRLCPNLRSIVMLRLRKDEQLPLPMVTDELRRIVADQWCTGKRKKLPLQVWLCADADCPDFSLQDSFLAIQTVPFDFVSKNHVVDALFRDEVFNTGGGTPSYMKQL